MPSAVLGSLDAPPTIDARMVISMKFAVNVSALV
jgi:hypothetical protein